MNWIQHIFSGVYSYFPVSNAVMYKTASYFPKFPADACICFFKQILFILLIEKKKKISPNYSGFYVFLFICFQLSASEWLP